MARVYDQGSFYRVAISAREVCDWRDRWPCSGLGARGYSFTFDKRNGDLVDHNAPESHDGEALVALSHDAQAYGARKLGIALVVDRSDPKALELFA